MCSKIVSLVALLASLICISEALNAWDFHTLTWNMQGSGGDLSKWNELYNVLKQSPTQIAVVALQESGSDPSDAVVQSNRLDTVTHIGTVDGDRVRMLTWSARDSRRGEDYYIYQAISHPSTPTSRLTYALLSVEIAQEVLLIDTPGEPRPILCIRLNNYGRDIDRYYCTLHAGAHSGNLSYQTIATLEEIFNGRNLQTGNDFSWMIMADFNRSPTDMERYFRRTPVQFGGFQRCIVSSGGQTQKSGGELDYAVLGSTAVVPNVNALTVEKDNKLHYRRVSDHAAVHFYPNNGNIQTVTTPRPVTMTTRRRPLGL